MHIAVRVGSRFALGRGRDTSLLHQWRFARRGFLTRRFPRRCGNYFLYYEQLFPPAGGKFFPFILPTSFLSCFGPGIARVSQREAEKFAVCRKLCPGEGISFASILANCRPTPTLRAIHLTMHQGETGGQHYPERAWRDLHSACDGALRLSQKVAAHLQQGSPARQLIPLLRRELELANSIRGGIHQLGKADSATFSRPAHELLSQTVEALLDQQHRNRQLLTRRGVKITGPIG